MVERITEAMVEAGARALDPDAFADYDRRLGYRASMDSEEERRRFADHYDERPEALRKARLVLAAALSTEPGEAEGWQPIETAPKVEQQEILVCNAVGERDIAVWWPLRGGWDVGIYYDDDEAAEVALAKSWTHWRPLPAPPSGRFPCIEP